MTIADLLPYFVPSSVPIWDVLLQCIALLMEIPVVPRFVLLLYILWVCYLAIANLRTAQKAGKLSKTATVLGIPLIVVGLLLDIVVGNFIFCTMLFRELPKFAKPVAGTFTTWAGLKTWVRGSELTMSARLKRWRYHGSGYRQKVADWFGDDLLDDFDGDGIHV